jgi:hypothetical protein
LVKPLIKKQNPNQGRQYRHHSLFAEAKPCGIKTIVGSGRSSHLAKGGPIGSGLGVCFGVTETPVGGFANNTKGIPVLRTDAVPDVAPLERRDEFLEQA